jgi:hypothetical protein
MQIAAIWLPSSLLTGKFAADGEVLHLRLIPPQQR